MKSTRYRQVQKKIPRAENSVWEEAEGSFSINLFLNLHTVKLRAETESNTKEKIG